MPNDRPHGQMYDPLCSPSVTAYSRCGLERRRAFDGDAAAASGDARCRLPRAEEYCRR